LRQEGPEEKGEGDEEGEDDGGEKA